MAPYKRTLNSHSYSPASNSAYYVFAIPADEITFSSLTRNQR